MGQIKLSQDRSSQVVTGQAKSEIFLDPKYFWTQIVFSLLVSLNLWLTISCVQNSLKINFFFKRKVLDTRLLWPENFSTRDQVDYLIVGYFESGWNMENLELECGPAQPDLFVHVVTHRPIVPYMLLVLSKSLPPLDWYGINTDTRYYLTLPFSELVTCV